MSGARPDTWMPIYWGDYLRDTMHLSTEEHGAYLLLLAHYWTQGGPFTDDQRSLKSVTKMTAKRWQKVRPILATFFVVEDGKWRHKRVDVELQRATDITIARQKAGKIGGKAKANNLANAEQTSTQLQPQSQPQRKKEGDDPQAIATPPVGSKSPRKSKIDAVWSVPREWKDEATEKFPELDIAREAERFEVHHYNNQTHIVDWKAAFMVSWLGQAIPSFAKKSGKEDYTNTTVAKEHARAAPLPVVQSTYVPQAMRDLIAAGKARLVNGEIEIIGETAND
jgi:uncharacterized protein YdaU (DUF1376 family)